VEGYVIAPGSSQRIIDAFVGDVDAMWEGKDPIEGLAVSDVELERGCTVTSPIATSSGSVAATPADPQMSSWRIRQYHLYLRRLSDHRPCQSHRWYSGEPVAPLQLDAVEGTEQALRQGCCAMMGIWIACEDVQPGAGPLVYYPRSQRAPLFSEFTNYPQTNRRTSDPSQSKRYDDYIADLAKSCEKRELVIRKGDVMFWHPMLVYGNSPAADRLLTRKSFVIHNIAEGADMREKIKGSINW
jgi:hypothetical protein